MESAPQESALGDTPRRPRLRIALLLDSFVQPRWVQRVVEGIQQSDFAEVVVVVKNEAPPPPPRSLWRKLADSRERLLHIAYERLDNRLFARASDPFQKVDIAPLVAGCPVVGVAPRQTKFCDYFGDADVEAVRAHRADVAVRFGFRILKGRALDVARYGVWSYHHGDNLVNRGGPAGFWEVMEAHPATGSILQVLTEELDGGRVIYRSHAHTDRHSVRRNRANYYWKSSAFLLRKLRDLYEEGVCALRDPLPDADDWRAYSKRLYTAPTNAEMARSLVRLGARVAREKARKAVELDQWVLAYKLNEPTQRRPHDVPDQTLYRFTPLVPPKDRFWADPFPVVAGGRHHIFFEEYLYAAEKAHISVMTLGDNGRWSTPAKVLERDYHLSYPFTFQWEGSWYLIPESGANRTVELYRAAEFPHRWELDRVLLSGVHAVDATLAEIDGTWWMFANVAEPGASTWDELHLFYADSPLGPWTPHRRNPVKSDVRSARPAGRLFRHEGVWYRPAQDCSVRYGYAIVVHRVERLDRDEYRESEASTILPTWMPRMAGTHTINAAGGLTVVDAWLRRPRLW
jgi:hypothetical protein